MLSPAAMAADAPDVFELTVAGELVIGREGEVREFRLDHGLQPAIERLVSQSVSRWTFEPVRQDGRAVVAKTRMALALSATEQEDGRFLVRVDDVDFGALGQPRRWVRPRIPDEAKQVGTGTSARVLVAARLAPDGRVTDAHALQVSLTQDLRADFVRAAYARAVVAAVKRWQFEPLETIDGHARGGQVVIPLEFNLKLLPQYNGYRPPLRFKVWKRYIPGPVVPAPWMTPGDVDAATAAASQPQEGITSLDSSFSLRDDVRGAAL